jgi:hypothetical protein
VPKGRAKCPRAGQSAQGQGKVPKGRAKCPRAGQSAQKLGEVPKGRAKAPKAGRSAQGPKAQDLFFHLFFQSQLHLSITAENAAYLGDAVSNLHEWQSNFVDPNTTDDKFNVLCHGDLWMQNVVFSYGSCLESQSDVVDVRFDDLHHARYASCVTDILNLLYYTVDSDIRRDHTVNLLSVYHDHFAKVTYYITVKGQLRARA